ncbi:MAG: bifunctional riboflavin kinase/FAD synthetase [Candidatus Omnitrophica bacterium]|nr:bifunctional riboflavin kinase/FAD synthetase [Candidatus Omnitrophota bacterium]
MKVIYGLGPINPRQKSAGLTPLVPPGRDVAVVKFKKTAAAIGIFDGVHRGHQLLIKSMVARARKLKARAMVITFFPHPAHVLRPDVFLPYLMSLEHRLRLFEALGVDVVLVIRFNKRFAKIDPHYFIEKILVGQLGVKSIFVGQDFRFGKDRSGDIRLFKRLSQTLGYRMHAVKALKQGGQVISSSRLRRLIPQGKLKQAKALLGRPVSVLGRVVRGASRGKSLGYPTANVHYTCNVLPPCGVYAVRVVWKKKPFYGMANLGRRPSFKEKGAKVHLEVHIFDFNRTLYGQEILVEFLRKIRDEKSFVSKEDLIRQIQKDERIIRELLHV